MNLRDYPRYAWNRLVCAASSHEWETTDLYNLGDLESIVGYCERCGTVATVVDAHSVWANGRSPPAELLDRDDDRRNQ